MRIKEVLKEYNITQIELAGRLGINRVSVSRLLSDGNDMRLSTMQKIADAIGCEVCELISEPKKEALSPVIMCPHCGKPITIKIDVQ